MKKIKSNASRQSSGKVKSVKLLLIPAKYALFYYEFKIKPMGGAI